MLPGFDYTAPRQLPPPSGLYAAATVIDVTGTEPRIPGGVRVWPTNCGPTGTWPSDPCTEIEPDTEKGGDREGPSETFFPVTVWGWDECGPGAPDSEYAARAVHYMDMDERAMVESAFADRLLTDAGAPSGSGVGVVDALGVAAAGLLAAGTRGVLHTTFPHVLAANAVGAVSNQSTLAVTGFPVAWGGGYSALDGLVIATGPVTLWRGEATVRFEFDQRRNLKMALAERTILVAFEPCHVAATTILTDAP